jgi:BetR domain
MLPGQLQKKIFDYLKQLLPPGQSLADVIGAALHLSNDSTYRRLRGETPLTVDELSMLCSAFNVSADQLLNLAKENLVMFEVNRARPAPYTFAEFVANVLNDLKTLKEAGVDNFIYASKDLPLFQSFAIPEFFAFKFHFWMHIIIRDPAFKEKPFEKTIASNELLNMVRECNLLYNQLPSTELWNSESINSTLSQIDYYRHQQYFGSSADLKALYDMLDQLLLHVEKQAEFGSKFMPNENPEHRPENYQLFYNKIVLSDNTMLVQCGNRKLAIINYGVLHYLACHNQAFCLTVEEDLKNMIRLSTKLSIENVRQRTKFFNEMHEKVAMYRKLL